MIEFSFHNPLCPGEYGIDAGIAIEKKNPIHKGQNIVESVIDYCPGGVRFSVRPPDAVINKNLWGVFHVEFDAKLIPLD